MTIPRPIRTVHDVLRGSSALSELGEAEIGKLASICKVIPFSEGTVLFNEGEQHDQLYFISGGSIRLDMLTALGRRLRVSPVRIRLRDDLNGASRRVSDERR